jgi:hypothetical protein
VAAIVGAFILTSAFSIALHADLVEREAHATATASGASLPRGFLH